MKLQISFDCIELEKALNVADSISKYADIIEVGTSLILEYGVKSVEKFRKKLPNSIILADTKIIDRGNTISELMFDHGADWITVMGGASKHVIHNVSNTAKIHNKSVMLDLLDSQSPGQSAMEAKNLGIDAVLIHRHNNDDDLTFLDRWEMVRGNTDLPIFISTDIDKESIKKVILLNPNGIVVGKAITASNDPDQEALFFSKLCK
jgi:3-hexulose-6-phosphate synthase